MWLNVREGINGILLFFQKKTMSNYYFSPQPALVKQSSQILTPLTLQQTNYTIIRNSMTDRTQQDLKNAYPLPSSAHIHQPLPREGSFKHLLDTGRQGQPAIIQSKSSGGIENQRTFSDYQINPGMRPEEQQLPIGGGYNISSKIGEKIKHKTDMQKSNSKATLANSEQKAPSIRYVESIIQAEKADLTKIEAIIQIINAQISKISEKVNAHEERIDRLQKENKRSEESSEKVFSTPQMEQINKILNLVEKSQQRDDYHKAIKMIEQLRSTILELNSEVKTLSQPLMHPPKANEETSQVIKEALESFTQKCAEVRQAVEREMKELVKRMGDIEDHWKHWKKDQETPTTITSSVKKFEGKMITLLYEERATHAAPPPSALTTGVAKNTVKGDALNEKQNGAVVLSSKTYYMDSNGYLLDKNKYYLLNSRNQQIRLTQKQIDLLRKHNIM